MTVLVVILAKAEGANKILKSYTQNNRNSKPICYVVICYVKSANLVGLIKNLAPEKPRCKKMVNIVIFGYLITKFDYLITKANFVLYNFVLCALWR